MKIAEVRAYAIRLAGETSYLGQPPLASDPGGYFTREGWASLYSAYFESVLVRITTDDGHVGWGEALAPVGPEVPAAVIEHLLGPALIGADPLPVRPLHHRLSGLMRERGHLVGHQADALAAVDIALWDLLGHVTGLPVAQILGGAFRTVIPAYLSGLPRPNDAERAALMAERAAEGVRSVKLHLGQGVERDLATVAAVQSAADDLRVAVDAHWSYSQPDAIRLGRELEALGAWFLEAPLAPEDLDGHRELAASLALPVAVGETLRNRYEFARWLGARALDIAQPDIGRTGITEGAVIGELAAARHVPVALHHSTGLGVVLAAGLHVAAALEGLMVFEFQPETFPVGNRILRKPIERVSGGLAVPEGPGLGIAVDEDAVRSAAIK